MFKRLALYRMVTRFLNFLIRLGILRPDMPEGEFGRIADAGVFFLQSLVAQLYPGWEVELLKRFRLLLGNARDRNPHGALVDHFREFLNVDDDVE